jgi:hypothetical protein
MQVLGTIPDLDYPPHATPEAVALALVNAIKRMENKRFVSQDNPAEDRKWLLETYAECLALVKGERTRSGPTM